MEHKLFAYADDFIFFLTSPRSSIPSLLVELHRYGALSNFKVNYTKLEAMGVSLNVIVKH